MGGVGGAGVSWAASFGPLSGECVNFLIVAASFRVHALGLLLALTALALVARLFVISFAPQTSAKHRPARRKGRSAWPLAIRPTGAGGRGEACCCSLEGAFVRGSMFAELYSGLYNGRRGPKSFLLRHASTGSRKSPARPATARAGKPHGGGSVF
ncbi:hypothetical protein CUJ91_26010 [Paraburkholderia graminis]|nr:hypothetical protein CUJ91_26010 [Paraburkholderia graminis]